MVDPNTVFSFEEALNLMRLSVSGFHFKNAAGTVFRVSLDARSPAQLFLTPVVDEEKKEEQV